ncbi:MAG: Histidine triad (HIT) protein [Candidatus Woesebacteria bacterium GW2011_GWA1_39_21]|uniref:Histidine triad (HIT) protein n=1 Tax=Candidatus Woesebacteria bacterium GW2011_GWA1_39_21 TaxID=1618550 RepID=A0A0G0QJG0_9BACT|nr:MAG: Histidine triad (HIT) protein [Candidatus Woesebacteria bacterium GW2011_GWA1_39_21]
MADTDDCIFCRIVKGQDQTSIEKVTDRVVVVQDVRPIAPIHLLIIPKQHIRDIRDAEPYLWDDIRKVVTEIASERKLSGFRITTNAGDAAMIPHMVIHMLAGITSDRAI